MRALISSSVVALALGSGAYAADYGGDPPPSLLPDLPVALAPATSWTGFYLGGHAGAHFESGAGATYEQTGNFEFAGTRKDLPFDPNATFGIQGGYLFQTGRSCSAPNCRHRQSRPKAS